MNSILSNISHIQRWENHNDRPTYLLKGIRGTIVWCTSKWWKIESETFINICLCLKYISFSHSSADCWVDSACGAGGAGEGVTFQTWVGAKDMNLNPVHFRGHGWWSLELVGQGRSLCKVVKCEDKAVLLTRLTPVCWAESVWGGAWGGVILQSRPVWPSRSTASLYSCSSSSVSAHRKDDKKYFLCSEDCCWSEPDKPRRARLKKWHVNMKKRSLK